MPNKVSKGDDDVEYIYTVAGEKLAKKRNGEYINFYVGSFVYDGSGRELEYVIHPEGLMMKDGISFEYQYNLADHLGNVRTVLDENKSVIQANDYYPFGMAHHTYALDKNKYL